jgi:predicted acylesterase/phospholipase RssA
VALSGGGTRASLFTLGALLYLVESRVNERVEAIASVSGGSVTNAVVATSCEFSSVGRTEFEEVASRLTRTLVERGIAFSSWVTRLYLIGLSVLVLAGFSVCVLRFPIECSRRTCLAIALVCAAAASLRGWLIEWRIGALLFWRDRHGLRLGDLKHRTLHVFCATDLPEGEPVFFLAWSGGGYLASRGLGAARADDLPLQTVVRASAAFPGAFPPRRLSVRKFEFERWYRARPVLYLADGGVWNNLGTQWFTEMGSLSEIFSPAGQWLRLPESVLRETDGRWHLPGVGAPHELIIDASAPLKPTRASTFGLPVIGEIASLSRSVAVLYQNTVSPIAAQLSGWLVRSSPIAPTPAGYAVTPAGALSAHVRLTAYLAETTTSISAAHERDRRHPTEVESRADAVVSYLTELYHRDAPTKSALRLELITKRIPTTLSRVRPADAVALLTQGYLATMVESHVVFGYPLLDFPGFERFERLLGDQDGVGRQSPARGPESGA